MINKKITWSLLKVLIPLFTTGIVIIYFTYNKPHKDFNRSTFDIAISSTDLILSYQSYYQKVQHFELTEPAEESYTGKWEGYLLNQYNSGIAKLSAQNNGKATLTLSGKFSALHNGQIKGNYFILDDGKRFPIVTLSEGSFIINLIWVGLDLDVIFYGNIGSKYEEIQKYEEKKNQLNIELDKLKTRLLDKILLVTGTITDVEESIIILDNSIVCALDPSQIITEQININDEVAVKGRCIGYDDLLEEVRIDHSFIMKSP